MAISVRSEKALKILSDGGKFCRRLETDPYTRREQFQYRLLNEEGYIIKGYGLATFDELHRAGLLRICETNTSVSTYFRAV